MSIKETAADIKSMKDRANEFEKALLRDNKTTILYLAPKVFMMTYDRYISLTELQEIEWCLINKRGRRYRIKINYDTKTFNVWFEMYCGEGEYDFIWDSDETEPIYISFNLVDDYIEFEKEFDVKIKEWIDKLHESYYNDLEAKRKKLKEELRNLK